MSSTETRQLIEQAVTRLQEDVPAFARLTLVVRLELMAHGGDAPIWRVEVPGPTVAKDPAGDARLDVSVVRSTFNELAVAGTLREWARAYEHGQVRVSGDPAVTKLLASVVGRQLARVRG